MKWVYVATAPDQITAEMWVDLLRQEGVPAQVRAEDTFGFLGVTPIPCRVMALNEYEPKAMALLAELGALRIAEDGE
ncbi:MAG: DUF2007 domain-containing protein [Dehalococcoidia bacterium]|nr:DUF2007 domain-containing protein [Dehalococcoidia bacterium]